MSAIVTSQSDIEDRFEIFHVNGSGVSGTVFRAIDRRTHEIVALKKMQLGGDSDSGANGVPPHVLREVSLLRGLRHPNIVKIHEVIVCDVHYTLVFEYVEQNLSQHLRALRKTGQVLPFQQVHEFTADIMAACYYCHSRLVMHRDIKPQNILVAPDGLKICDFGLARPFQGWLRPYTHEVVTLWYRPPEILLGAKRYGPEIDVWSAGCVVAEMAAGFAIFAGDSEIGTLFKIFQLIGTPTQEAWPQLSEMACWNDAFPIWANTRLQPLKDVRSEIDGPLADLIEGTLTLIPGLRWDSRKAIRHCFGSAVTQPADDQTTAMAAEPAPEL